MSEYIIQIAETRNFEVKVTADDYPAARGRALKKWRDADTVGQWKLPDVETEIVSVTRLEK